MSPEDRTHTEEIDEDEDIDLDEEPNLEEMLELDLLPISEASTIARDITVEWIRTKTGGLTEEQILTFYRNVYQVARFPTLAEEDEFEEDFEDEEDEEEAK